MEGEGLEDLITYSDINEFLALLRQCHLATFKTFYAKPSQRGTDTLEYKFKIYTVVREVYVVITVLAISLVLTTFGE